MSSGVAVSARIRAVLLAVAAIFMLAPAVHADTALSDDASAFTETLVQRLAEIAADPAAEDPAVRTEELRAAIRENLAVGPISRFLLSSNAREAATPEQQARYDELFPDYIAASFAEEIDRLAGRTIAISAVVPRRDDEVIVQSQLITSDGREAANIDWRVREIEGDPRLLDVLVERVSPLVAKREAISALFEREGMGAVIAHIEDVAGR